MSLPTATQLFADRHAIPSSMVAWPPGAGGEAGFQPEPVQVSASACAESAVAKSMPTATQSLPDRQLRSKSRPWETLAGSLTPTFFHAEPFQVSDSGAGRLRSDPTAMQPLGDAHQIPRRAPTRKGQAANRG